MFSILRFGLVLGTLKKTGALTEIFEYAKMSPLQRIALTVMGLIFYPFSPKGEAHLPPIARAIQALGPAYIKFGQILSTRPDIVGKDFSSQLRVLQDRLPPFSSEKAKKIIESELQAPIETLFTHFDPPVAAASIAQVHPAIDAHTGKKVAVKVLRPGIERAFQRDINAFYTAAYILEKLSLGSRRLKPRAVVAHFEGVVTKEMDFRLEAAAAAEFYSNIQQDKGFKIPKVIWPFCNKRVMATEWVDGTPMGDVEALRAKGYNCVQLSDTLIQTFLKHALRDGYFHADMHQGNLRVDDNGEIIALDFGIMGRLDIPSRRAYAKILYGFLEKDYQLAAQAHMDAGYLPEGTDLSAFAQALRAVGDPIFGQDATRISMGRLLAQLLETTERFGMEELILLQRTMVVVEGVARSLNPNANIWDAAKPVVKEWIRYYLGPQAVLKDLITTAQVISNISPHFPEMIRRLSRPQNDQNIQIVRTIGWGKLVIAGLIGGSLTAVIMSLI
jgi:ubiquinone biosynthesis protein